VIELHRLINPAMLRAHDFKITSCARKNGFVARGYDEAGSRKCEIIHRVGAGQTAKPRIFSPSSPLAQARPRARLPLVVRGRR
jgi:hypothetical protein